MLARFAKVVRQSPWMGGVGLGLVLVLAGIVGGRWIAIQNVTDDPNARREAVVAQAFSTVEERFGALQERVRGRAQQLATDSLVVRGLQAGRPSDERPSRLVQRVLDVPVDDRTTVEVYTPLPRILAWNGRRLPLGDAPNEDAFLQRPQSDIVSTGPRKALVVWWPVRQNDQVLGVVRVVRVIQYQPPVKNRYIQGFSLQDEWEQATGESIRLTWAPPGAEPDRPYQRLRSVQGTVLGHVTLRPPTPERLVQRTARFYDNLLATGSVLLSGWMVVVVGLWYLRLARRPGVRRHSGARAALAGRLGLLAGLWVTMRYALLGLDVPGRWMEPFGLVLASSIQPGLLPRLGAGSSARSVTCF